MFSSRNQPLLGVRIISVEYGIEIVAKDTFVSPLTNKTLAFLPVVYIFGPNSDNESCSITVKECFPYFYIDWPASLNDLFDDNYVKMENGLSWDTHPYTFQGVPRFHRNTTPSIDMNYYPPFKKISDFLKALSYVLNSAFKEFTESGIVYTIDIVLRRSIYGFHLQRRPFFKIYLLQGKFVPMAAQLLYRGQFYGIKFQPYNLHLLGHQFLVDHNLFGMDVLWAYKKDLKISSNTRLTCKYNYTLKAGNILNSSMNARKLMPSILQDKESLVDIIKGSHFAYLCDSQFNFTTMLKRNKQEYYWKDLWTSGVWDDQECILTTSLQEFWKDEVKRRRSLKQIAPEPLKILRLKETPRFITSIHQMVKEKFRAQLENLCPSFFCSNYTFHEKLDVHFEDIQHSKDQITLPLENKFKIHYSDPFDMPQRWFLKKFQKNQLTCKQPKLNFFLYQTLAKGNKFFFYGLPPPSVEQVCNTVSTFSQKTNGESFISSDLTSGIVTLSSSTLIENQHVESLANLSSNNNLCDTSSETISDTLSLDDNKKILSNQSYNKKKKRSIQTCGALSKKKPSHTALLDLLQKRYRERFKSSRTFFPACKEKKQSKRLPCSTVIPQYHTILGLNVITNTVFNSKSDEALHFVPNPRVDKLLGVVYMLRCESWNNDKAIASSSYMNTFDTRFGVVQVVDTLPFSQSWDTYVIPISQEVYQAKYVSDINFFLNKKEMTLDKNMEQSYVPTESDLIFWILHNLFREFDPSFVLGFDIQTEALGFIFRRAVFLGFCKPHLHFQRLIPNFPLKIISYKKLLDKSHEINLNNNMKFYSKEIKLMGRVILNLWKLLKQYEKSVYDTLGGLVQKVLHTTYPLYSLDTITEWWNAKHSQMSCFPLRNLAIHYKLSYLKLCFKLFDTSDLFNRFSEHSRFLGTDITSTIHRGSQYHVEGLICRAGTLLGYVMPTAAKIQVANQPAIMSIPLVLEPESKFYEDPVVVLDFQSLYPSIIIAYNLCFSTCLGHISYYNLNNKNKGRDLYEEEKCIPLGILSDTCVTSVNEVVSNQKNKVTIFPAPNGVLYVVSNVRKGILPSLLEQVISTRLAIKKSIQIIDKFLMSTPNSLCPSTSLSFSHKYANMFVRSILDARQAALKNFANFTYGYTSASYSGRMPCSDIADSIVHIAKDTLKRAIITIESHPKWNARVVYGDTDSLFVLLKDRSLNEAFIVGQEIIRRVTSLNPWPVELRMEKVYMPCILQTKKRYVGWKYVSETQPPVLESKGIETIRRDQCGVMVKCLTNVFEILFKTYNISKVKEFLLNYWMKMQSFEPQVSLIDFIFYRKIKFVSYSYFRTNKLHTLPPQAFVACRLFQRLGYGSQDDPEWFYEYGKRVSYVVVKSTESSRLCDMVTSSFDVTIAGHQPFSPLSPVCFLKKSKNSSGLILNVDWYITNQMIPTLDRYFSLIEDGLSVKNWFLQMPRRVHQKELQHANIISKQLERMEPILNRTFVRADYPNFNKATQLASFKNSSRLNGSSTSGLLERHKAVSNFSKLQLPTFTRKFPFCQQKIDTLIQTKKIRLVCELCGSVHYFEEATTFSEHSSERGMINFFCPSCRRSPDYRIHKLYAAWNQAEQRFSKYMQICINCSGSRFAAEACQNALYCRVYTARNVERQRLYQSVLDIEDCHK